MFRSSKSAWVVVIVTLCLAELPCRSQAEDISIRKSSSPRLALLVGIEKYPKLSVHEQLDGCVNDTELMRQVLIDRYQFDPEEVVVLTNEQATGEGIRNALKNLLERLKARASPGEPAQVVFHFSGHGSQLPDEPAGTPGADELDGLDETLVPSDASLQGGPEDIRDDELNEFIEQVCAIHDSKIWVVLDCCHSGTGARGLSKFRSLERGKAITATPTSAGSVQVSSRKLPDGAIVLSACQSFEKEPEYREGDNHYGLLTRFLGQVLSRQTSVSNLSYEALHQSLLLSYRQAGVVQAPTPQLEGNGRGIVLSAQAGLNRPSLWKVEQLPSDPTRMTLSAGALQGITTGSLFEVYERPDQASPTNQSSDGNSAQASVWLEIDDVLNLTSKGRLLQQVGQEMSPIVSELPFKSGYAIERRRSPGSAQLTVQVIQVSDAKSAGLPLGPESELVPEAIRQALLPSKSDANANSPENQQGIRWVKGSESAEFAIKFAGNRMAVFPATGNASTVAKKSDSSKDAPSLLAGGWGPIDLSVSSSSEQLVEMLAQIKRARNLLRIAAGGEEPGAGRPEVQIELVKVALNDDFLITSSQPWPRNADGTTDLQMRDGDYYAFQISNREPLETGRAIYVTVLLVDSNMGIDVVLPYPAGATEEQLFQPGESRFSDPFQCNGESDTAPIYGIQQAVVLATREPNDFYLLATPSLQVTRGGGPDSRLGPLSELLTDQLGPRSRGGAKRLRPQQKSENSWSSRVVQWRVSP